MDVAGLSPSREVWFGGECDGLSGAPVGVLAYRIWADRISGDPHLCGSTIRVHGGGRRSSAQDRLITTAIANQLP